MTSTRKLLNIFSAVTGLFLASCEQVVPYPDTGAKEQLCLRGVIGDINSSIIIQKLHPVTWQTPHFDNFESSLEMSLNGEKIDVQCKQGSTYYRFYTERTFNEGDVVSVTATSYGMPEASATVTIPKKPLIDSFSISDPKSESHREGFIKCYLTMNKPSENSTYGYTFSSEVEYSVTVYKNGAYDSSRTEYYESGMTLSEIDSDLSYRLLRIYTCGKDIPEKMTASGLVSLSGSSEDYVDGDIIRTESTATRIRFHIMCLSPELLTCARYSAHSGDTSLDSDVAFSTPIEYTNITGGKGYLGAVSKTSSEWIEL